MDRRSLLVAALSTEIRRVVVPMSIGRLDDVWQGAHQIKQPARQD